MQPVQTVQDKTKSNLLSRLRKKLDAGLKKMAQNMGHPTGFAVVPLPPRSDKEAYDKALQNIMQYLTEGYSVTIIEETEKTECDGCPINVMTPSEKKLERLIELIVS